MDGREELAVRFEAERGRLGAVARRMLGSTAEAEDAVQEAWLRLERVEAAELENLPGWLTTVVSRICLDVLRGRRAEPVVVEEAVDGPEAEAELVEEVGRAMLVVLDRLGPAERVAFVLHDGFAVPFEQIGPIVGRNTVAAKKRRVPRSVRPARRGGRWWRRSWPPRAGATWTRCSPCSLRRWCAGPTRPPCPPGGRCCCAAPGRWPGRRG